MGGDDGVDADGRDTAGVVDVILIPIGPVMAVTDVALVVTDSEDDLGE